jgi:hypothetical protein
MLVKRMPLLLVFAGGCLSGAVLIGFVHADPESTRASKPMKPLQAHAVTLAQASDHRDVQHRSVSGASAVTGEPEVAAPSPERIEPKDDAAPESGTSLTEVLARLEATYRAGLAAAPAPQVVPPPAPEPAAPVVAAAPVSSAVAVAAPMPAAPPAELPAVAPKSVHVPVPPPASLPSDPAHVVAARDEAPPGNVHVGDVNNVNIASVHLGDVVQVQQLALLQYMQLLALTPGAGVAASRPGIAPPAHAQRRHLPRRPPPFSTSLTDPNNPWGFDFPPTVLAK